MSQPYFRFKRFTVWHDRCAQRVGTDGVLLGAWSPLEASHRHVLDIGAGCGLVSLMAAQRLPEAQVVGVEVDPASAEQARENVLRSPFAGRVTIVGHDIRCFSVDPNRFDHIHCNPPFHTEATLPPDESRSKARNAAALSFESLIRCAVRLLAPDGLFSVIIPSWSAEEFASACFVKGLFLARRCDVQTVVRKPPRRSLLTFSFSKCSSALHEAMVLQDAEGGRSPEYQRLTADFYLDA